MNTQEQIKALLEEHHIVLFMKGTPMFPQCGFSAQVAAILGEYHVEFHAVNVLMDDAIRQGIKVYGNWPTIPQLYVDGELIGGCDIITALHEQSQLAAVLA
ncbi:MAG: Grx4 family monothiol glutaredoxin [Gammaproteobacteria bacterium]|jgi:monothiol glutaredoxin|nr:Grx4 family monothiol glutaredoxin [Gammaproteobacteria bacterium]